MESGQNKTVVGDLTSVEGNVREEDALNGRKPEELKDAELKY